LLTIALTLITHGKGRGIEIHQPWSATPLEHASAGIEPGKTYPPPIVDHKVGRERALPAYASIRNA
jgi:deoxyribodipyrimidine photo-lyase